MSSLELGEPIQQPPKTGGSDIQLWTVVCPHCGQLNDIFADPNRTHGVSTVRCKRPTCLGSFAIEFVGKSQHD